MTPGASSPFSQKPAPESREAFQTTTNKEKTAVPNSEPRNSGGTPSCLEKREQINQGLSRIVINLNLAADSQVEQLQAHARAESHWEEGTVYGRLASLNSQPGIPYDRDAVYCDRAADAIKDFEKKL